MIKITHYTPFSSLIHVEREREREREVIPIKALYIDGICGRFAAHLFSQTFGVAKRLQIFLDREVYCFQVCHKLMNATFEVEDATRFGRYTTPICAVCCGDDYCNGFACETIKRTYISLLIESTVGLRLRQKYFWLFFRLLILGQAVCT